MIKTTASALSWDEWAKYNDVAVVNVPVGFKEIANIMKKVELQLKLTPYDNVFVDDVFGKSIDLGVNPRLIFAGEESGGMIMGAEDMVKSLTGREAIAMREKHSKLMTLNVWLQRCLSACYIVQITHKESNFTNLKCERYEQRT